MFVVYICDAVGVCFDLGWLHYCGCGGGVVAISGYFVLLFSWLLVNSVVLDTSLVLIVG